MSKRNQRWGKAITIIREAGPKGATAFAIGNAVLKDERRADRISANDKEALGLALGCRLVEHRMAVVTAANRLVITEARTHAAHEHASAAAAA